MWRRANVMGWRKAPGLPPLPALLLGLCTAHLRTAEGLKKHTHPGLSVFEFRPYISVSSGAAVLCAELYLPSETPNKKTFRLVCWGKCPPCRCRGGVPHGMVFGQPVAASPALPQSPTSLNRDDSLLVKDNFFSQHLQRISQPYAAVHKYIIPELFVVYQQYLRLRAAPGSRAPCGDICRV